MLASPTGEKAGTGSLVTTKSGEEPVQCGICSGGMGGYLAKLFPNNYFVIGTSTSEGTYAVTKDRFIKRTSKMIDAKLPKAPENSIENNFAKRSGSQVTLINLTSLTDDSMPMRMRIAGYDVPRKDRDQFPSFDIKTSFDLLIHIIKSTPSSYF